MSADVAVHSAKDLPGQLAAGLALAAFPERADPRDALVARESGVHARVLPPGARVGTGSTRRMALLRAPSAPTSRSFRCGATCRPGSRSSKATTSTR